MPTNVIMPLDWDSKQLGVQTAKITATSLSLPELQNALDAAKLQNIKLLYWVVDQHEAGSIDAAKKLNGILTDHKVTYLMDLTKADLSPSVESYQSTTPSDELIHLAYESGNYSRFRADPNLTEEQFQQIYKTWITNSVNRSIAEEVLVINDNNKLSGMITLGEKNSRGDIGLLAVSAHARGKNIGTTLVHAAQHYFIKHHYQQSQVVTQQNNVPACRLYEKCGYHVEKVEYFFHFWI
jgi:dTDP-4-amino-4,6-dideoxy-D-galactose acyltransferase